MLMQPRIFLAAHAVDVVQVPFVFEAVQMTAERAEVAIVFRCNVFVLRSRLDYFVATLATSDRAGLADSRSVKLTHTRTLPLALNATPPGASDRRALS